MGNSSRKVSNERGYPSLNKLANTSTTKSKLERRIRETLKALEVEEESWRSLQNMDKQGNLGAEDVQMIGCQQHRCEAMRKSLISAELQLRSLKTREGLTKGLELVNEVLVSVNDDSLSKVNALTWNVEKRLLEERLKDEVRDYMLTRSSAFSSSKDTKTDEVANYSH